jgi:pyruvate/2-oxoglutarate/acetoin dehydrogenase E1 component
MAEEMPATSTNVFLMGEEVGEYQGAYKISQGLLDRVRPQARDRHADHRASALPVSPSARPLAACGRSSSS